MKFVVCYATQSGNLAELHNAYRSEEKALVTARNLADALNTTCTVERVEHSPLHGLLVRTRVAVIVNTAKFNFEHNGGTE